MGPLTVAERGVFAAGRVDWDVGMFRRAGRGGLKAQAVGEGSGTSPFSRRTRGAGTAIESLDHLRETLRNLLNHQ